ncbi:hypothetical protein Q4Q35_10790 [Flavivirga aquimarina]|uniref:Uncharacterized protein n=1 Tax=Flavivirga aquimarina TaxID=2027862 RepID=A0ABT8WAW8_9FLAO|nr:hypothetical protein [Flavivirga aquimarina]MDO5970292.1 hypothetical protein [Flavivirga aquimarina]
MREKLKIICAVILMTMYVNTTLAQNTKNPHDKVHVFDMTGQGIGKAFRSSHISSQRKGGILIATVVSDVPEFFKLVKDVMNDNIAAGRRRLMIVHAGGAKGEGIESSMVALYANGETGDVYYFEGDGEKLKDTGTKLFFSVKSLYEKEIEPLNN